jgi:hypothetical protein
MSLPSASPGREVFVGKKAAIAWAANSVPHRYPGRDPVQQLISMPSSTGKATLTYPWAGSRDR